MANKTAVETDAILPTEADILLFLSELPKMQVDGVKAAMGAIKGGVSGIHHGPLGLQLAAIYGARQGVASTDAQTKLLAATLAKIAKRAGHPA